MQLIELKPMSVNQAYTGQRFKTTKHRQWAKALTFMITKKKLPPPPYEITFVFGLSNPGADWDGPIKQAQDVIFKKYGLDDKVIYRGVVDKVITPVGEEFIMFDIQPYQPLIFKDGKLQKRTV